MKHYLLLTAFFCFTAIAARAQQRNPLSHTKKQDAKIFAPSLLYRPMAVCTQLNVDPDLDEYIIYTYPTNGGFPVGTNEFGDKEVAGIFTAPTDATFLTRAQLLFGFANSNIAANLTKDVRFKVYDVTSGGLPGTLLATVTRKFADLKDDVDNIRFTDLVFSPAVSLPANKKFALAVDVSDLVWAYPSEIDSLVLFGWEVDQATENFYFRSEDDNWFKGSAAGIDIFINIAIFPIVSDDPTCLTPTPVRLSSFNAQKKDDRNEISWSTQTEQNNAGFWVQHSVDGINFENLAAVRSLAPAGNSNSPLQYQYSHLHPAPGVNYYRLMQKDLDGKTFYSKVAPVTNAKAGQHLLSVFPNPVKNDLQVQLEATRMQNATFTILDMHGRTLRSSFHQLSAGQNRIKLDVRDLKKGGYVLKVNIDGTDEMIRFIK